VGAAVAVAPSLARIFYVTSVANVSLFAACQAGLVNNLNDGMSWGLYPLFFAAHGLDVARIGVIKAVYPAVWGLLQIATALLSGLVADALGFEAAIHVVAALTLASGLVVAALMKRKTA